MGLLDDFQNLSAEFAATGGNLSGSVATSVPDKEIITNFDSLSDSFNGNLSYSTVPERSIFTWDNVKNVLSTGLNIWKGITNVRSGKSATATTSTATSALLPTASAATTTAGSTTTPTIIALPTGTTATVASNSGMTTILIAAAVIILLAVILRR